MQADKAGLANSLRLDEEDRKLGKHAPRIATILERLNVTVLTLPSMTIWVNLILRGDGSNRIRQAASLTIPDFPAEAATVALMKPPFPHKNTVTPAEHFVERGMEGLHVGGKLVAIVPAIGPGRTLIISPTEADNGTYGRLDFGSRWSRAP